MPVPTLITDLSTTAASNSPAGTESPTDGDNYLRALSAFVAQLRDITNGTSAATATIQNLSVTGTLSAAAFTPTSITVSGVSALNGGVTLGDASGDALTINSNTASIPNGLTLTNGKLGVGAAATGNSMIASSLSSADSNVTTIRNNLSSVQLTMHACGATAYSQPGWASAGVVEASGSGGLVLSGFAGPIIFQTNSRTTRGGITTDGRLYGTALHNNAGSMTGTTNQYIGSGTYTPTGTAVANCSSVTPGVSQWIRTGNVVHVWGTLTVSFTTTTLSTTLALSLPIASNFTLATDLNGKASGTGTLSGSSLTDTIMLGTADTTNDRANFNIPTCQASGSHTYGYSFAYEVK